MKTFEVCAVRFLLNVKLRDIHPSLSFLPLLQMTVEVDIVPRNTGGMIQRLTS